MHNDDNRWQTIFIEYFLYVYGNRQAVDGHAPYSLFEHVLGGLVDVLGVGPLVRVHPDALCHQGPQLVGVLSGATFIWIQFIRHNLNLVVLSVYY